MTVNDAVERSVRLLRFQLELGRTHVGTLERDAFAAGYLWGFCGGALAYPDVKSPGLFPMFSMVCRQLFGDRDGSRMLVGVQRQLDRPEFEDGEAAGLSDARLSATTDRVPVGLVVHLGGGSAADGFPADGGAPGGDDPDASD